MANYLIITGGSKGIGEKTITRFMDENWKVINISRTPCKIPGVIQVNLDLASTENIEKHADALRTAIKDASKICLVHNAAMCKRDNVESLALDDLKTTLNINVVAPAALNKVFIPYMLPGSSIIYLGSTLSEIAVPGKASYVISKHAIVGLMRSTCQDLADKLIHTCCICPGLVETDMLTANMDKSTMDRLLGKVVGNRLVKPEEIANVIYFCASTETLNGIVIHANLGSRVD